MWHTVSIFGLLLPGRGSQKAAGCLLSGEYSEQAGPALKFEFLQICAGGLWPAAASSSACAGSEQAVEPCCRLLRNYCAVQISSDMPQLRTLQKVEELRQAIEVVFQELFVTPWHDPVTFGGVRFSVFGMQCRKLIPNRSSTLSYMMPLL